MSRKHKGSPTTDPAEEVSKNCHVELEVVWRRSLPEAPAGPPLVVDLDGDGVREIALNLLAFQTLLVSAADGRDMPGWPVVFPGSAFQTPPVLYWRDSSTPRLVVGTTAGELLQISTTGRVLPRGMRAPPLAVPRDWVGETGAPEGAEASMFLQDSVLAEGEDLERLAVEEQEREDARRRSAGAERVAPPPQEAVRGSAEAVETTDWSGFEGWLPPEGLESLKLFGVAGVRAVQRDPLSFLQFPIYNRTASPRHVLLDAQLLAPPVVADLEGDGRAELLVAVSYGLSEEVRAAQPGLPAEAARFFGGGLVCFDLETATLRWERHFEVSAEARRSSGRHSEARASLASPPLVVDLDGDGRLEVVQASELGVVYAVNSEGAFVRYGRWPVTLPGAVRAAAAAQDLDGDGRLEMVVADLRGQLHCLDLLGEPLWDQRVQGPVLAAPVLAQLERDDARFTVLAVSAADAHHGQLHAFRGDTGAGLPGFPLRLDGRPLAPPLPLECGLVLVATERGVLHLVDPATGCMDRLDLGAPLRHALLAGDLSGRGRQELLLASSSQLLLLALDPARCPPVPGSEWLSFNQGRNRFWAARGLHATYLGEETRRRLEQQGRHFQVQVVIEDQRWARRTQGPPKTAHYNVTLRLAGRRVWHECVTRPGTYTVWLESPGAPRPALLQLQAVDHFGLLLEDSITLYFHTALPRLLKYLLVLPFLLSAFLLLFAARLLPPPPLPTTLRRPARPAGLLIPS